VAVSAFSLAHLFTGNNENRILSGSHAKPSRLGSMVYVYKIFGGRGGDRVHFTGKRGATQGSDLETK
jgi:hypothetical protein